MRRVGLGRSGRVAAAGDAGDPLEGVVNLFDVGIVLAAAALIAAAGVAGASGDAEPESPPREIAPAAGDAPRASGAGRAVGTVYRLPDGRLVYVERPPSGGGARAPAPIGSGERQP